MTPSPCDAWNGRDPCLPCGLARLEHDAPGLALQRVRLRRGEALYRQGDRCTRLNVVRSGALKSVACAPDGLAQVVAFHLAGEVAGIEGWPAGRHLATAVALEDTEVQVWAGTPAAGAGFPLERAVSGLLGRELQRARQHQLLACRSAEQRLAGFLLDLSQRMRARGYSSQEFLLRMSRSDIAGYLGLKLETVSRGMRSLQEQRLLQVRGRHVRIDLDALRLAAPGVSPH